MESLQGIQNNEPHTDPGEGMCTNCWDKQKADDLEYCWDCAKEAILRHKNGTTAPKPGTPEDLDKRTKNDKIIQQINAAIEEAELSKREFDFLMSIIPEEIWCSGTEILETIRGYKMSSNIQNKSRKVDQLIAGLIHLRYGYHTPAVVITEKFWYAPRALKNQLEEKSGDIQRHHTNNVNFLHSSLNMMQKLIASCPDAKRTQNNTEAVVCNRVNEQYLKLERKAKKPDSPDEPHNAEELDEDIHADDPSEDENMEDHNNIYDNEDLLDSHSEAPAAAENLAGRSDVEHLWSRDLEKGLRSPASSSDINKLPCSRPIVGESDFDDTDSRFSENSEGGQKSFTFSKSSVAKSEVKSTTKPRSGGRRHASNSDANKSKDAEPPQSHNASKTNTFPVATEDDLNKTTSSANSRSTLVTTVQNTPQSTSSPYQTQGQLLQQGFNKGSPHPSQNTFRPAKRSGTMEHIPSSIQLPMVNTRQTQSPTVYYPKMSYMGGIPTPFTGSPSSTVSSTGRFYAVSQGGSHPQYQPSTTYNPGYQEHPRHPYPQTGVSPGQRYQSEVELLESQQGPQGAQDRGNQGVMPSMLGRNIQESLGTSKGSLSSFETEVIVAVSSAPEPTKQIQMEEKGNVIFMQQEDPDKESTLSVVEDHMEITEQSKMIKLNSSSKVKFVGTLGESSQMESSQMLFGQGIKLKEKQVKKSSIQSNLTDGRFQEGTPAPGDQSQGINSKILKEYEDVIDDVAKNSKKRARVRKVVPRGEKKLKAILPQIPQIAVDSKEKTQFVNEQVVPTHKGNKQDPPLIAKSDTLFVESTPEIRTETHTTSAKDELGSSPKVSSTTTSQLVQLPGQAGNEKPLNDLRPSPIKSTNAVPQARSRPQRDASYAAQLRFEKSVD